MNLKDGLRSIESLNNIVHYESLHGENDVRLNYNEMTFIPYLSKNKGNKYIRNKNALKDAVDTLAGFVSIIKETDLNTLTTIPDVVKFSARFSRGLFDLDGISAHTKTQAEFNGAWIDFYAYGIKTENKNPHIINKIEDQREQINHVGQELDKKYKELSNFLLFHYTLLQQLPKSLLHEEDRAYVVKSINTYTEQMPSIQELASLQQQYQDLNKQFLVDVKQHIVDIAPDTFVSKADAFILKEQEHQTNNTVENFLNAKLLEEDVKVAIEFTAAQKIQKVFLFDDRSIAYKRNNEYHTIKDSTAISMFINELHHESLSFILRKKPTTIAFFQNKLKEDGGYSNAIKAATSFVEHSQVLKQYNFDLNTLKDKGFEAIDDTINNLVYKNKVKQFAFSILSAKYKHHFNSETEPYFKDLFDNNVTTSQLQTFVGKKIAALKSNEDVIKMINGMLDHFNGFTQEALSEKLQSLGIEKIHDANNAVSFEVTTYEQCKALGTTSWCIVRDEDYFNQYVHERGNRQYIIYDFNKLSTDIQSMIGFTVEENGDIYAEHWKNDDSISRYGKSDTLTNIQTNTIYNNQSRHSLSEEKIVEMEDILNIKDVKKNKPLKMRVA